MIPAAFDYHAPTSLAEATALLARLGEDAKILSGGQSLIPIMKLRLSSPPHVVDINGVPGLAGLREVDGFLRIGALTRESELEESALIRDRYPLLHETSRSSPIRSCATSPPSAATSPTPTRPTTTRPRCWHWAPRSWPLAPAASGGSRSPRSSPGPSPPRWGPTRSLVEIRVPVPAPRQRRRLRQARAQGRRLRHRGGGGAAHAVGCRRLRAGRHRPDQRRARRRSRPPRAEAALRARSRTRRRLPQAARLAAEASSRPRICGDRSSTSVIWCGCSRRGRCAGRSRAPREGA